MTDALIRQYYAAFNERRIKQASVLLNADAIVEHLPLGHTFRGPDAYSDFAEAWLTAFPDARLTVEHVEIKGDTIAEVDLTAEGTHCGTLQLGTFGTFKPTGNRVSLRIRELLEFRSGKISYSCLSFDTHGLVRQLMLVDYGQLATHLDRLHALRQAFADAATADRRRDIVDAIGRELDAARLVVRPWFRR